MQKQEIKTNLEDDVRDPLGHLIEHRLPWLFFGLLGGIITTIIISKYEKILAADVRLAFFIPIMVYLSDAVGTQTETIYVRHIKKIGAPIGKYLLKETGLGLGLGVIFGLAVGIFASLWLKSPAIGLTVGLAMFINMLIAPVLATLTPAILYKEHADPALGAGPLATIIQYLISIVVYFAIASLILF